MVSKVENNQHLLQTKYILKTVMRNVENNLSIVNEYYFKSWNVKSKK